MADIVKTGGDHVACEPIANQTHSEDNERPQPNDISDEVSVSYKKIGESMGLSGNLIVVPQSVKVAVPQSAQQSAAKAAAASTETTKKDC